MVILSSVLEREHMKPADIISLNWHVYGLVELDSLPAWHVQYYSALTHLINGLFKPALLDYAIAFEIFIASFLRERLTTSFGASMTDYVLRRTEKIEERVKGLLEQACGQSMSSHTDVYQPWHSHTDVYQPWHDHVQRPRNHVAHGKPIVIDTAEAERAHQAIWQAIRWIESLPR
jgi:hypothetical protein